MEKIYIAIDLKSFYASVECHERGLNPLTTNLVVADNSRTDKTVCLAVTPSLKQYGISGRARLFEVIQKVKEVNAERRLKSPIKRFTGSSYDDVALKKNPDLELTYIVAPPRMRYYMEYSTKIYNIYLKWFSAEDIYVYSIDEVFIDVTHYLKTYNMRASELITKVIQDVYENTGITATGGMGTNLYLAKVAMDIVAKHAEPNENGVRIAGLNEAYYRKLLWNHTPITDFWRVGNGTATRLKKHGILTMGDIARVSINNEELLYKLFGINAELLIDHAWGWEPVEIKDIKAYRPTNCSLSTGQVLHTPYNYEDTKIIVKEMTELLTLDMVEKNIVTNQLVLTIGYDVENITNRKINYNGEVTTDRYGRKVPKHAHGTVNLDHGTASTKIIMEAMMRLYDRIINKELLTRRITVIANNVVSVSTAIKEEAFEQIDLFTDYHKREIEQKQEARERNLQKAMINIKGRYGKNAIIKGMNLQKAGTTIDRNNQVGGHKA